MATVYAAVTSLMGTIQLISQSTSDLQEDHKEHLKLLYDKVGSMLEFLDTNSDDEPMRDLLKKVKDVAHKVEDEVESHIWRGDHKTLLKILQRVFHLPTKAHERLLKILQRAIEEVDSVKEELNKLKDNNNNNNMRAGNFSLGGSSSPRLHVSTLENNMVGHNIEQELMRGQLTGHSSQLEVISIAGMGGIGKSTFAKRMFNDPSIVSFFDVRGWVTVSKDYNLRKMLLSLLQDAGVNAELDKKSDIGEHREEEEGEGGGGGGGGQEEEGNLKKKKKKISDVQLANRMQKSDGELADRLQKSLKGRRYLIVVDDIWSTEAWDEFRLWFPEYNNRSRILLTTRDIKVAQYASYPRDPSPMRFLKPEESWTLFCQKAFDQKVCPIEFENIAREVVKNCNGLPLMISVVAGALSSKRTVDEWRKVAQSVSSLVNLDDYQRCSRVLALSYNHLPSHLKACFLYFGVFPKASEISVKKLIRLWVAEGFLELKGFEGLEKVATSLLSNLIDKSLVVVGKRSLNDKIKTCRIHDLLHDFCLREAENENLLYVTETPVTTYEGSRKVSSQVRRWVSVYPKDGRFSPIHFNCRKTRSLLVYSYITEHSRSKLGLDHFKRLRVLQLEKSWYEFPSEVVHLVALRYLSVKVSRSPQDLPIFNLMNLQTFIFPQNMPEYQEVIYLPSEIWEMSQLRHLRSTRMYLYSPPPMVSDNEVKYRALENLQSVCGLIPGCCTKEIFEGIKKVKKLGIYGTKDDFNSEPRCLENLMDLHELEALTIVSYRKFNSNTFLSLPCPGSFPPNLKKLTLCCTFLLWKDMTIVSMLPKLEVLQLRNNAFVPNIGWKVTEMQFPKLKFLLLEQLNIKYWRATDDCFPCLERIIIRNCRFLIEIPQEFADSMTLQLIELHQCYPSLVNSAELIQKEQLESLGNNMLKVYAFDTIKWRIWEE
ncbi:putative late blight resistance protein homolog R1A-10 isoform X1 [Nicotiana tomentosiformis]|uniref:putative late blight resistance protein homolog R1A-10 isoform X1 n=1 Tax=Nicotiana tomentosiformis TaxID=4098 RepID=UPI00388C6531